MKYLVALLAALTLVSPAAAQDRSGPLRIEITQGVIEPVPIAVAPFIAETPAALEYARQMTAVVSLRKWSGVPIPLIQEKNVRVEFRPESKKT